MRPTTLGEHMTLFLLFFGVSLLDALSSRVWWRAAFWLAIAIIFALLAWRGQRRESTTATNSAGPR